MPAGVAPLVMAASARRTCIPHQSTLMRPTEGARCGRHAGGGGAIIMIAERIADWMKEGK